MLQRCRKARGMEISFYLYLDWEESCVSFFSGTFLWFISMKEKTVLQTSRKKQTSFSLNGKGKDIFYKMKRKKRSSDLPDRFLRKSSWCRNVFNSAVTQVKRQQKVSPQKCMGQKYSTNTPFQNNLLKINSKNQAKKNFFNWKQTEMPLIKVVVDFLVEGSLFNEQAFIKGHSGIPHNKLEDTAGKWKDSYGPGIWIDIECKFFLGKGDLWSSLKTIPRRTEKGNQHSKLVC